MTQVKLMARNRKYLYCGGGDVTGLAGSTYFRAIPIWVARGGTLFFGLIAMIPIFAATQLLPIKKVETGIGAKLRFGLSAALISHSNGLFYQIHILSITHDPIGI